MRNSCWLVLFVLSITSDVARARTIELACVHREYSMKLHFSLDPARNIITHDGVRAREVQVDNSTISFFIDLISGEYFHFITRSTGRMTMRAPDGTLVHGFECRETTEKF
jgi:hypothetical protein